MKEVIVCISPEEPLLTEIVVLMKNISEKIESKKALIFPPHITLCHRIHTDEYNKLITELTTALKNIKPFDIQLDKIGYFTEPTVIFLEPNPINQLKDLHNKLLPIIIKHKDEWVREGFSSLPLTDRQKELLNQYGSPFVLEFYNSHMSIAGSDCNIDKFNLVTKNGFDKQTFNMKVNHVCIMTRIDNKWVIEKRIYF